MKEHTYICKYLNNGNYCILTPVFYEHEARPAWRKWFIGSPEECKKMLPAAPDFINASTEENNTMRNYRLKEYLFLINIGKNTEAAAINNMYHFS